MSAPLQKEKTTSLLSLVTKGKIRQPILALVYGPDGVGKSTFGADAPNPIFLGTEKGTANLDVARYPAISSYRDVLAAIQDIASNPHQYETLVIDSLDWLEPLVWEQVCIDHNVKGIEDLGYGKGYVYANKYWMDTMHALSMLREKRNMNVVVIAHAQVKLAKDPQAQAEYDRYQLKLNEKAAGLWREFVDSVLFANFEVFTKSDKNGKTKAFGEGARVLFTERRPGFDAKNRMGLPYQLPLSWEDFKAACDASNPHDPETLHRNITEMTAQVPDEATRKVIIESVEKAAGDVTKLEKIQNRLRALTANQ